MFPLQKCMARPILSRLRRGFQKNPWSPVIAASVTIQALPDVGSPETKALHPPLIILIMGGMVLQIQRLQVWSGEMPDLLGSAAGKLEQLLHAGAELAYVCSCR